MKLIAVLLRLASIKTYLPGVSGTAKPPDENSAFAANGVANKISTRGGRVQETIDIVRAHGGIVSAVDVIVDRRGETKPDFGCPFIGLVEMSVENFPADNLPRDLSKIPAAKPDSK